MKNEDFKPLVGNTVIDKAMNSEIVMSVLEEQSVDMTQRPFEDFQPNDEVVIFLSNFATKVCDMAIINSSVPTFKGNWKKDFANETWKMLEKYDIENFIKETIKEMRSKFGNKIKYCDLFNYGFSKIANHAGIVARMILHEYHPDLLKLTSDESDEALLEKVKLFQSVGVPTAVIALNH